METTLHISSLVVLVTPSQLEEVASWVEKQSGAEIVASAPEGKLVVVLESAHESLIADWLETVRERSGVLDANMVYHEILTSEEAREPCEATPEHSTQS